MSEVKEKDHNGFECRFVTYVEPPEYNVPDLHVVKLQKHNKDGTVTPELKLIYDFKRPFYIANKGSRNYQQHKEWEEKKNLIEYKAPQSQLVKAAATASGYPGFKGNLKRLCKSPYIYGVEIGSTAILKKALDDAYPELKTRYSVAVADIETDVVNGTKDIIMMSLTCKTDVTIAVLKSFLQGEAMVEDRFDKAMKKYLGDVPEIGNVLELRKIKYTLKIVDTSVELIRTIANKAHELKPDFLTFWNIDFDVPKIIDTLSMNNVEPKDVFSDPIIPKRYRYFDYKQGPKSSRTASGVFKPIKPAAQWHTVTSTSSFYFIDAMCVYKQVRTGKQEEQSYSLDKILKKNKLGGKLKFSQADHLSGLPWHQLMQSQFKIEYMVYNIWDSMSVEMLDEKNGDLGLSLPMFSGFSDFKHFSSQPRRLADKLHYYVQDRGYVIGTTPPKDNKKDGDDNASDDEIEIDFSDDADEDEDSDLVLSEERANTVSLSLKGWIITLPAHLVSDNGMKCIEEFPDLTTNIHVHVGDLDVTASYPNGGATLNISKETTVNEIGRVEGIDEYTQRMQGINIITAGHVNSVEYCNVMFNFPSMFELLEELEKEEAVVVL